MMAVNYLFAHLPVFGVDLSVNNQSSLPGMTEQAAWRARVDDLRPQTPGLIA